VKISSFCEINFLLKPDRTFKNAALMQHKDIEKAMMDLAEM
jgi:hypothetical protein